MSLCPATPPPTPCTPWDPRAQGHLQGWPMCPILLICCCRRGATCHYVSSLRALSDIPPQSLEPHADGGDGEELLQDKE